MIQDGLNVKCVMELDGYMSLEIISVLAML